MADNGGSTLILHHASGASATVLKYGATVISWKLADGIENLFLSTFMVYNYNH